MSLKLHAIAALVSVCACGLFPSLSDLTSDDAGQIDAATDALLVHDAPPDDDHPALDGATPDVGTDAPVIGSIAFRAAASNSGQGTNVTVNKPTGTVTGDFMWALLSIDDDVITVNSIPQTWSIATQLADGSFGFRTVAYQVVVQAGAPTSYSITLSNTIDWSITLVTYTGVRTSNPFDVAPVFQTKQATPPFTAQSISTTVPNALVLVGFTGESGNGGWSSVAPLVQRATTDFLLSLDMTLGSPGPSNSQMVGYAGGGGGMIVVGALAPQ